MIRRLDCSAPDFDDELERLLYWGSSDASDTARVAAEVIEAVRARGDAAVLDFTRRFDRLDASSIDELTVMPDAFQAAFDRLTEPDRQRLRTAGDRIRDYHQRQLTGTWSYTDEFGNELGQRITPVDMVGVYVPGGQAAYPSTVLMTAIPARVAGVAEVVMVVPAPEGVRNDLVFGAAHVAGVDRAFTVGGAQAIAALAYGTARIPRVDKIVGPGGAFVAAAKRLVYGQVGIDAIAGPSEILVIADGTTPVEWVVMDLFSQAEHDAAAQAILLCPDADYIEAAAQVIERRLPQMGRRSIIEASLDTRGALIRTRDLADAAQLANRIAPEHLELAVADPDALLPEIRHAGAIFMGAYSGEVIGDYAAGPSHVLPTFGTARFSSPLGVYDFQKKTSIIRCTPAGVQPLAELARGLAEGEGLEAHARAAAQRLSGWNESED